MSSSYPVSHQMLVIVQREVAYPEVSEQQPLAMVVQVLAGQ